MPSGVNATMASMRDKITGLYAVIDSSCVRPESFEGAARALLSGGVGIIQVRAKDLPSGELLDICETVQRARRESGALFIVNDRVDIALICGADGVHLGQDDIPIAQARRLLGASKIIGVSTHNVDEAREAESSGADYISFGPVYPTKTKKDAQNPKGCPALVDVRKATALPIVAIGGITEGNMAPVFAAGADAVAMISYLLASPNPTEIRAKAASVIDKIFSLKT